MNQDFVREHLVELLADAFTDGAHSDHPGKRALVNTCRSCGAPSTYARCNKCLRAYQTERGRLRRQLKGAA